MGEDQWAKKVDGKGWWEQVPKSWGLFLEQLDVKC